MSRICVKNLPAYVTEPQLKEHFGAKWEVTDAKVIRTKEGESRKFGFVGYRTDEDAKAALKFFNKSFLGTSRLFCEEALAVNQTSEVRPWSRYSKGSSAYEKAHKVAAPAPEKKKPSEKKGSKTKEDPQLAEFLSVMQPRSKTKLWANDTVTASETKVQPEDVQFEDSDDEDDEEDKDVKNENEDVSPNTVPPETDSNLAYFKSRIKENWDEVPEDEADDDENEAGEMEEKPVEKMDVDEGKDAGEENAEKKTGDETGRLFVRNLAYTTREEDLTNLFTPYGEVSQVHVVLDRETNRSKGFAYVMFKDPESATRALQELDKSIFQGRLIHILPAERQPAPPEKPQGAATFKKDREADRKKSEEGGNTKAWNSLYMRPDTVAENVAKQYGLTKREFMDPEAEDLAVRLALGETHVIAETKRALSNQGVNVEVYEDLADGKSSKVSRSNYAILVKNLPFSTTEEELSKLFGSHGNIGRLILPPTKTLAIVEFLEASEARRAFKALAYRKFKYVPLYLEWAPEGLLNPKSPSDEKQSAESNASKAREELLPPAEESNDADVSTGRSVFVKNLNFKTTEAGLKKYFETHLKQGSLRKATVKTKSSKKGDKVLSMGFGFLEFESLETAQHVCKTLQGTVLDGHALVLSLSHGDRKAKAADGEKKRKNNLSSTKIIIRNVAFEATKKDLKQLFSPFGQMKKLKLPKKFDGKHRGFAFAEFVTKQEAKNAFEALASTHLYGRHLALEWAREDETLEELRARTASQFFDDEGEVAAKKPRLL